MSNKLFKSFFYVLCEGFGLENCRQVIYLFSLFLFPTHLPTKHKLPLFLSLSISLPYSLYISHSLSLYLSVLSLSLESTFLSENLFQEK